MSAPVDERILVLRLIAGDEAAFRAIFDRYRDRLFTYCLKFTKSREAAEEIVQDVFMKIWENRLSIDPDLSFNAYLYQITKNLAFNFLKKAAGEISFKQSVLGYLENAHNQSEDDCIYQDYEQLAESAISLLPPKRQMIFQMSRQEGMSHEAIAASLGISKNTVKVQIVKASKTLRAYFRLHTNIAVGLLLPALLSLVGW
ncbi:RNA polymerase sigma-70 factor [soil metagenome]